MAAPFILQPVNRSHYLFGTTKRGERMRFNFRRMRWTHARGPLTAAHRYDGGPLARMLAEVNGEVEGLDLGALHSVRVT